MMNRELFSPARERIPAVLSVSVILFVILFWLEGMRIHGIFGTSAYDLGIFDQHFWLLSRGLSAFNTVRGMNLFGDHFSPIEWIFAPLYRLYPSVGWPLIIQASAVGSGALLLCAIGRDHAPRSPLPVIVAVAFLVNPVVHNPLVWQYHTLVLVMPLLFAALRAYLAGRLTPFTLWIVLALLVREDVPVTVLCFGLVAIAQRRWRFAAVAIFAAVAWWAVATLEFMPWLNGEGYFRHKTGTLAALWEHRFDISFYSERLFDVRRFQYVGWLLLPLLGLPLGTPWLLVPVLPSVLANLLIGDYNIDITYHYSVAALPFLFVAALRTLERLRTQRPSIAVLLGSGLLLANVAAAAIGSNLHPSMLPAKIQEWRSTSELRQEIADLDALIGDYAGVAASDYFLPHFAHRPHAYLFPNPWQVHYWGIRGENPRNPNDVQWLVLAPDSVSPYIGLITYLQTTGYFRTVHRTEKVWVLHRERMEANDREAAVSKWKGFKLGEDFGQLLLGPAHESRTPLLQIPSIKVPDGPPYDAGWNSISDQAGLVNLDLQPPDRNLIYGWRDLYARIDAAAPSDVLLEIGSDDGLEVWWNGNRVINKLEPRRARLGDERLLLRLRPGQNHLYLRVVNYGGAWRLLARIMSRPAAPLVQ